MRKIAFATLFFFFFASDVIADFRCETAVHYRWQKKPMVPTPSPVEAGTEAQVPADAPTLAPVETKPIVSVWAKIEKIEVTEEEARAKVEQYALRERMRANEACVKAHQNLSGCISSKMAAYQSTLASLTFAARARLEESVIDDCTGAQGTCLGAEASKVTCVDLNPPEAEEDAKEEKEKK